MYMCACVCVCLCAVERKKERERGSKEDLTSRGMRDVVWADGWNRCVFEIGFRREVQDWIISEQPGAHRAEQIYT